MHSFCAFLNASLVHFESKSIKECSWFIGIIATCKQCHSLMLDISELCLYIVLYHGYPFMFVQNARQIGTIVLKSHFSKCPRYAKGENYASPLFLMNLQVHIKFSGLWSSGSAHNSSKFMGYGKTLLKEFPFGTASASKAGLRVWNDSSLST